MTGFRTGAGSPFWGLDLALGDEEGEFREEVDSPFWGLGLGDEEGNDDEAAT